MMSTLAQSTFIPLWEILCPSMKPPCTMKWHFFQFNVKLLRMQSWSTWSRFANQFLKIAPKDVEIIHEYFGDLLNEIGEYSCHAPLKGRTRIA